MKIGPKYKIAKRLGAPIFSKTQSPKFVASTQRGGQIQKKRPGQTSDFKRQLIEKQKMRFTYAITEKQLRRYVDEAMESGHAPSLKLTERLEARLDNVVYRLGLAKTRQMARQVVGHGHITVNGRKLSIPSYKVRLNDVIAVREGSRTSTLFVNLAESLGTNTVPAWLTLDAKKFSGQVLSTPTFDSTESQFDPAQVLEYYSR